MEHQSKEQRRANNIIWTAAGDYSLRPDIAAYDGAGKADLYWNFVLGAAHRYYDYSLLRSFFVHLKEDPDYEFYESLTWIGLENGIYQRGKTDRPVIEDLRCHYSRRLLGHAYAPSFYFLVDEIKIAHFQRALGIEPPMRDQVRDILNVLEFDGSLGTEQIISRMNEIINTYFSFNTARYKRNLLYSIFSSKNSLRFGNPFLRFFRSRATSRSGEYELLEKRANRTRLWMQWQIYLDRRDKKHREDIQNFYGTSLLMDHQVKTLEQTICVGNHKNCHLHITRGEFRTGTVGIEAADHQKNAIKQRQKNKSHYQEHLASNNNSILKLTHIIKNAILVNLEASPCRAKTGKLIAGKIWRNIYLYDNKLFSKNIPDDTIGGLEVDILLDASCSQINRQERIASQAYIIAESLTRCKIPVRVYAFCTSGNYTIINLFRDYREASNNSQIFNYHATGCNRDGLAIRTALHMMDDHSGSHKILIVLSDSKPVDPQGITVHQFKPEEYFYADAIGIQDTALEVRKGRQKGVSVLCVFTGLDEDLPAARKIYGHSLVRIKSSERFADMVGVLLQNELKNL